MYFTDTGQRIVRANLDGTGQEDVLTGISPEPGIALDLAGGKMYWGEADGIHRANLNGTGMETVLSGLAEPVGDIALDLANGKIYWLDRFKANLHRANLSGTGLQDLVTGAIDVFEGGLALDVAGGKVYWSEPERIRRANLDGSSPEDLVAFFPTDPPNYPADVALDLSAGKLYWSEIFAFGIPNANKIRRANLNGAGAEDVITGRDEPYALALDVAGAKVYWVEGLDIFRGNFNGTGVETVTPSGGFEPGFLALDIQTGATTTFAGLPNTALGGASMSLDLNNHLVISNIGASGLDGVSFFLGQAQFGELDFGSVLALSPGAFVQASAIGSLNNVPGQTIGTIRFTGVSGGNTNVQFDLSAVGNQGPDWIVYNGATQVFRGTVPGNSVEVAGTMSPDWIPFQPQGANAAATVFLRQKLPISIPGGPTVTGDRIVAFVENLNVSPDWISEISVTGANLSSFTLEEEELGQFGFPHGALGAAQMTATLGQVTVSNLGATLLDGVSIDVEEAGTMGPDYLVELAAVPLSGVNEQVHFAASVGPDVQVGPDMIVDLLATGSGFDVNVDYSAIGASLVEVMVFNAGAPVGSAIVPAGNVGTITAASGPIALTRTFVEAAGSVTPCCLVGFQHPVSFAFPSTANSSPNPLLLGREGGYGSPLFPREGPGVSSASLIGDEIHFHAVNPTVTSAASAASGCKWRTCRNSLLSTKRSKRPHRGCSWRKRRLKSTAWEIPSARSIPTPKCAS